METLKTVISWLLRIILAGVLIYAGCAKIARPDEFFTDISNYRIFPVWTAYAAAYFMPPFEIVVGIFLLTRRGLDAGLIASAAMMAVFIILISSAWARGLDISCGCFGNGGTGQYFETIVRDRALILCAAAIHVLNKPHKKSYE